MIGGAGCRAAGLATARRRRLGLEGGSRAADRGRAAPIAP
jgi:hypothetical protein